MFTAELPAVRKLTRRFMNIPEIQSTTVRDVTEASAKVHPAILGLLRPKGVLTRELQQPPRLNHRMLNPHVLLNEHKSDDNKKSFPPLMESATSTDERLSFENGDPISFTFFEVGQEPCHSVMLRTHSRVEVTADDTHDKYDGFIVDPDLRAGLCTKKSFKRLVRVLGYEWHCFPDEDDMAVDLNTFIALMKKLSYFKLDTNSEIKKIMEHFWLDRLMELDGALTPAENRDRLSEVICALQPCRLGVYNGQHREAALKA